MSCLKKSLVSAGVAAAFLSIAAGAAIPSRPALAGEGGAFVGGLVTGHVLTRMSNESERETREAERRAYSNQQAPAQSQPQQSEPTVEERLETLDKLAADGRITKEEYDKRRQAIIDGI